LPLRWKRYCGQCCSNVIFLLYILSIVSQEPTEIKLVNEWFRFRNEHKADSAELYFADTVQVYMKYMRNVPKEKITASDKQFWKNHPKNKFEMTAAPTLKYIDSIAMVTVMGKEYLDGINFKKEKIEIKFKDQKIISVRAVNLK